jgi:ubiquinone/menaquinone biosynthesis C-methylase UbiE
VIPDGNVQNNIDRFSGFGELYDKYRPEAPQLVVEIISAYLQRRPELVVDTGCGTGLSSFIWDGHADQIAGIEPNPDMLAQAQSKLIVRGGASRISFVQGYSNQLELEDAAADVVTCSQSFHWMEPVSTLREISRVLRQGGVFAAYDCDWPPTLNWNVEHRYSELIRRADAVIARLAKPESLVKKRDKERHLHHMNDSGVFRFTKEIVFHNMEKCDAERYVGLMLSQGGLQTVFKLGATDLDADIAAYRSDVDNHFRGRTLEVMFSYRMRLGIK